MRHAYSRFGEPCKPMLAELTEELGLIDDQDRAFQVLRALFDVLRKKMSPENAFELVDALPFCLKTIFVDNWVIHYHFEPLETQSEFKTAFLEAYGPDALAHFVPTDKVIIAVKDCFRVFARHMGEVDQTEVFAALPDLVRPLWEETVMI